MRGFLLDTNVVSELVKPVPEPLVIRFLTRPDLWLSTITLHEMDFGLSLLPAGRRRERFSLALLALVSGYEDRILPIGRAEALQAAKLRAQAHQSGRVLHLADALVAGIAKANDLWVATRNVGDFNGLGIDVTNPWDAP